jgi:RNA recognition motif-containing protein
VFSKYGEIKSIKIPKVINVTKILGQLKETVMSRGFCFVCFDKKEAADRVKEELNEKPLPGHNSKRPLLIEHFMPKNERKVFLNQSKNQDTKIQGFPLNFGSMFPPQFPFPVPFFDANPKRQNIQQPYPNQSIYERPKEDLVDTNYLKTLEDDNAKKDYLGEIIFKAIENHDLVTKRGGLTIDTVGRITGMILGIEDIGEIIQIAQNPINLSQRIQEALELLEQNEVK